MMKLVDMQGLKPCPEKGPGSIPGVGINVSLNAYKVLFTVYTTIHYFGNSPTEFPNLIKSMLIKS